MSVANIAVDQLVAKAIIPLNGSGPGGEGAPEPDLPKIVLNNRQMREISYDAIQYCVAANDPPIFFMRSGLPVRIRLDERSRPIMDLITPTIMRSRLVRVANFVRTTGEGEKPAHPSDIQIGDVFAALDGCQFPALDAIIETPAMRPDGTVLSCPGYDPATSLYYVPAAALALPAVPDHPTAQDVTAALAAVDDAIGEFPYEDSTSHANALALLLTPILRPAISGNVPLALIDAPQAGTGKSLLAEVIAVLTTGRQATIMTAPDNDEEWRKRITSALADGATIITIDNLESVLMSASLAAVMTTGVWKDRILGVNKLVNLSQRATWLATGNNIRLAGDMPRRCYWIRLNAQTSRPWRRTGFAHPALSDWVLEHRGVLLAALLTIARAWYADGCPVTDTPPLGSFESWSRVVGSVLAHAGVSGFLANLDALYERVDDEAGQWQRFLEVWLKVYQAEPVSVADLAARLRGAGQNTGQLISTPPDPNGEELAASLPDFLAESLQDKAAKKGGFQVRLGKALTRHQQMYFGEQGIHLEPDRPDPRSGRPRWRVLTAGSADSRIPRIAPPIEQFNHFAPYTEESAESAEPRKK